MEQKEATMYQATKMFNWTEAEAKEKLFEGEELREDYVDVLLEADKARVAKLKEDRTKQHDAGFQKAEKQFKTFAEDEFKRLTGFAGTETNFEEMFKSWQETEKKKWQKNIQVDEDAVKKHPVYIALESERVPKNEFESLKTEYEQYKSTEQRNRTMGVVSNEAWGLVAAEGPILEKNETVAANRRRDFLAKLGGYDYDLQGKEPLVLTKEGKRIEDEHGNPVTFKAFVLELSRQYFEFRTQTERENAANNNNQNNRNVVIVTETPTTKDEYNAAMRKWVGVQSDEGAKQRIAIKKYYDEHKKD